MSCRTSGNQDEGPGRRDRGRTGSLVNKWVLERGGREHLGGVPHLLVKTLGTRGTNILRLFCGRIDSSS